MKLLLTTFIILTLVVGCSNSKGTIEKIEPEEVRALQMDATNFILLDVRTPEEYNEKHIPDATLIPLNELKDTAISLLPNLDQQIVIYCRSGNRSAQAAKLLSEMGYTNIYDLGGINNWPYETE